jgi:hypothetical protein
MKCGRGIVGKIEIRVDKQIIKTLLICEIIDLIKGDLKDKYKYSERGTEHEKTLSNISR